MPPTEADILERIIEAEAARLPPEAARYLQSLALPPPARQRLEELTAREGTLTHEEQTELERYRHVSSILERVSSSARHVLSGKGSPPPSPPPQASCDVAPGIRRSQAALRRELPQLLAKRNLRGQWVCYAGDERIGVASSKVALVRACLHRGLDDDAFYVGKIEPHELVEEEDLGPPSPSLMVEEEEGIQP